MQLFHLTTLSLSFANFSVHDKCGCLLLIFESCWLIIYHFVVKISFKMFVRKMNLFIRQLNCPAHINKRLLAPFWSVQYPEIGACNTSLKDWVRCESTIMDSVSRCEVFYLKSMGFHHQNCLVIRIFCWFQKKIGRYDFIPRPDYEKLLPRRMFYQCSRCGKTYFGHGTMETALVCANCLAKNLPKRAVSSRNIYYYSAPIKRTPQFRAAE